MKGDHTTADSILRRHGELPVASRFDSALQSTPDPNGPSAVDPAENHAQPYEHLTRLPVCSHCQDNLFVRLERVLSGRRVSSAYYCGRCNREWQVEATTATTAPVEVVERRVEERRRRPRPVNT